MSIVNEPIMLDSTGKAIVEALTQKEMTKARIAEIESATSTAKASIESKTDEQLARIPEVTQLAEDVESITPDDTTITTKPWTSKKTVDALCPPFESSGGVVQCNPVEGYPLGVKSRIDAVQEGTGDPSPDNVRPIIGWEVTELHQSNDGGTEKTYTAALPETVYGGELDWETGVLTADRVKLAMNGNENWYIVSNANQNGTVFALIYAYPGAIVYTNDAAWANVPFVCSHFKRANATLSDLNLNGSRLNSAWYFNGNARFVYGEPNGGTDIDDWKSFLSSQYSAGMPVTVVYGLAEPYTIQLTPQQIAALSGVNTLYSNSGDTTVSGRTDPVWLTQSLIDRIAALESAATEI